MPEKQTIEQRFDVEFSHVGWLPENKRRILDFIHKIESEVRAEAQLVCIEEHKATWNMALEKAVDLLQGLKPEGPKVAVFNLSRFETYNAKIHAINVLTEGINVILKHVKPVQN